MTSTGFTDVRTPDAGGRPAPVTAPSTRTAGQGSIPGGLPGDVDDPGMPAEVPAGDVLDPGAPDEAPETTAPGGGADGAPDPGPDAGDA